MFYEKALGWPGMLNALLAESQRDLPSDDFR